MFLHLGCVYLISCVLLVCSIKILIGLIINGIDLANPPKEQSVLGLGSALTLPAKLKGFYVHKCRMAPVIHRVEIIMGHWTGAFGAAYLKSWSLCPEGEGPSFLTVLLTLTYLLHFFQ